MITSEQCRLARGWLGWDQKRLAEEAGVGRNTISLLENGKGIARKATLMAVRRAFEEKGVQFKEGTIIFGQQNSRSAHMFFAEEGLSVVQ